MRKNQTIGRFTKQIAARVRSMREAHNVKAADLARELGFSRTHWSAIEHGKHPFDAETLNAIAGMFGVSVMFFMEDLSNDPDDKLRALLGKTFRDAWCDTRFRTLITKLAKAHKNQANNWTFEACARIMGL
jgi:transcriptional regulator with XRE-family HTH domain